VNLDKCVALGTAELNRVIGSRTRLATSVERSAGKIVIYGQQPGKLRSRVESLVTVRWSVTGAGMLRGTIHICKGLADEGASISDLLVYFLYEFKECVGNTKVLHGRDSRSNLSGWFAIIP